MSSSLDTIYDELLMRHIRQAHRYGLEGFGDENKSSCIEISNPLCGDTLTLKSWKKHDAEGGYLSFACECCGIAMGTASLMTLMLEGASLVQMQQVAHAALAVLRGEPVPQSIEAMPYLPHHLREDGLGGWQLLKEIARTLPGRKTCASLSWQAVLAEQKGKSHIVAVEVK